jgi:hypothetical protein
MKRLWTVFAVTAYLLAVVGVVFPSQLRAQWAACGTGGPVQCAPNGNVGIGTTNPQNTFEVVGTTTLVGNASNGMLGVGTNPQPNQLIFTEGSATLTAYPSSNFLGVGVDAQLNATPAGTSTGEIDARGVNGSVGWFGTSVNPAAYVTGGYFQSTYAGSTGGSVGNLWGGALAAVSAGSGTVTTAYGGSLNVTNEGGGSMTTAAAGMFSGGNSSTSTMGTYYGGYFANPGTGGGITNNYGICLENEIGGTNNYAIYSAGGKSYFGGPIGLGVTNPACTGATKTCMLAVAGAISAQELVVTTAGADYVFDPAYSLKPLTEVADYVRENHHLPDIPSAAEMAEKGVSVGELQSKLLSKIEELTLHMIDAQKENGELRERIARLERGAENK